ncbi:hypothetical protein DUI87_06040 [Hirundo rustica rustica]|uniref:GDNF/GAS1 domain-containing protein n=1 Tax=Hirundo rustica rustica TaxID=333673 RepID=A0A3M0KW48_HIRRU|nr:hypothetical protein DUI87_06040 [Hirundo rustica rustica]
MAALLGPDYLESFSRSDTELTTVRQHRDPGDQRHSEELESECSIAKQRCQEEPGCSATYRSFQRACRAAADTCSFPTPRKCLSAWKELRKTALGKCTCSEPLQTRCIKIWKRIFNNPCLQYSQESQASGASENDGSDDDYNADGDGEKNLVIDTVYTTNRSCLDVNRECIEDEVCNKQLSLYLKVCSVNKKCNVEGCQAAIRFFYRNMPFEIAQMMIFVTDDMPCSANADCKAAYISNWGTMLHMECTCQNLPPVEQPLCELFHHMLHSKSCFSDLRQISIQKKGFHWANTEMPGDKISGAQLHSSAINGETVYIIACSFCIALILGIVLLTLLKIRQDLKCLIVSLTPVLGVLLIDSCTGSHGP